MGVEILGGIVALLLLVVPLIIKGLNARKAKADALAIAESTELGASMSRVDKLHPND